jgi:hypothetical protein
MREKCVSGATYEAEIKSLDECTQLVQALRLVLDLHCTMRWGLGGPPCVHRCAYVPSPMCCKKHIFI